MYPDKHKCVDNFFFFKGVGAGFVVKGKRYMTAQKYVVISNANNLK